MLIKDGIIYTPDENFITGSLEITNTVISAFYPGHNTEPLPDLHTLDAGNCYVLPGLIDTHLHGCNGADISDGTIKSIEDMARFELSQGITTFLPATMTLDIPSLERVASCIGKYTQDNVDSLAPTASVPGLYMEGPFFSKQKVGAQNPNYLLHPDYTVFQQLQRSSNYRIKIIAIAPELPGSGDFLCRLKADSCNASVSVSLGHTCADGTQIRQAFSQGANRITHLYNAMEYPDEMMTAATEYPDVMAELICDGVHNSRERIQYAFEKLGKHRIIMISDSMRALGLGDGTYTLGGQTVTVKGNLACLADGRKAGSVSSLADCLRATHKMGFLLEDIIPAVTKNPARSLSIDDHAGILAPGYDADITVWTKDLTLKHVIKAGKLIF